jgi:hypothetical protein
MAAKNSRGATGDAALFQMIVVWKMKFLGESRHAAYALR